jgi:DNA-binding LacI/PurR family transcriptional regulator
LRRRGMRRALRRAGIEPHRGMEVRGPHGREAAREMALRLLRRRDPPSAIFAASDVQAMGVLEAADVLGVPVPDRLAVIGFDDIEVAAPLGLSTVRQPLRETGVRGAEMLLAAIDAAGAEVVRELAMLTVVERRTT